MRRRRQSAALRNAGNVPDRVPNGVSYADIAARLGTTESAVKSVLHRLRRRIANSFREEVAATVSTAAEIEEELRH